jgi:4-amino-4-deoxy-L-arabinose transferase-like glycosyltransferase
MSVLPRFGLKEILLLLLVVAVAAGLRVGYLLVYCDNATAWSPIAVQGMQSDEQRDLINSLRDNWWFGGRPTFGPTVDQSAHVAPGYPWLVSLIARLPLDLEVTVRWSQCGLGAITAGLYFLFARRAFRSTIVGLLAGLATAAYPAWIVNTAEFNDGVLATFLLAFTLWLGARVGQEGGPLLSLLLGIVLAMACLVRPAWLPFGFAVMLWFLLRCRELPRGWFLSLLVVLGFANGLAPWTVRNYQVVGDIVPLVDSAPVDLWMGNCPDGHGGQVKEAVMLKNLAQQRGQEVESLKKDLAAMTSKQRASVLLMAVVAEAQAHPAETLHRRFGAGVGFFLGGSWLTTFPDEKRSALNNTEAILAGSLVMVMVLSFLGWRWSYGWRRESMPASLAVVLIPLPYLLSHAEVLHGPRLPMDGVLICFAVFASCCLVPGYGKRFLAGPDSLPQQNETPARG